MKQHPILFSTPMVQAILAGQKTMSRRIVKGLPLKLIQADALGIESFCPYGKPGDILWVRESFTETQVRDEEGWFFVYKANGDDWAAPWKPSIHMPKSAARLWLEITNIRIERLKDITYNDAIAEGVNVRQEDGSLCSYITSFEMLWRKINGWYSWDSNPWVWVIEFKRIEKPQSV